MDSDVVVGIDAGGTSTRARAVRRGRVVHEGSGGPGNPATAGAATMRDSFAAALRGCPTPGRVVAAVAGGGHHEVQGIVRRVIADLYPGVPLVVTPDYVAAYHTLPPTTDVCVIAGTGSVVCSRRRDGSWLVDGGRGWILGDAGSAARLGQALLRWYVEDPGAAPEALIDAIARLFGTATWRDLVQQVHSSPAPAAWLARASPVLTAMAEQGDARAASIVRREMKALVATTVRQAQRIRAGEGLDENRQVRVGLVGGVWTSRATKAAFRAALEAEGRAATLSPVAAYSDCLSGVLRIAAGGCDGGRPSDTDNREPEPG
jgi:N-acetylglucosamine kinase-like BadF-type ATPase